ncbi:hypothetical protein [Marinobacter halophilus]|uniref:Uncharacterized protein n=1 Tax=Marinobacter halophilus TaxID=1323740 RepID=A0A2T1K855_9GAMM|nr:hypothetical protein [Marinobacter halophilus]PSF06329.1 hypothetical protein C7H08_14510 [Marinobacter halophilus]GGC71634.1 hypothetical protein GCM10011362_20190 [Marinobacter halophilus]
MIALLLTTLCLAGTGYLLFVGYRVSEQSRRQLRILNAHRIAARSAIQKSRLDLAEVRNRARLLEDTVSGGASAVEKVHKAIANTTFGLIDMFSRDEDFRDNARKARQSHEQKTEQVYKAVRTTNRALHILADSLIMGKAEKRIVSKTKKAP